MNAHIAHTQEHARIVADEERGNGVFLHELAIYEIFLYDHLHHRKDERRIRPRPDGNELLRFRSHMCKDRIDDDDVRARLDSISHEMPFMDLRIGDIVTPDKDVFRVLQVARIVAHPRSRPSHDAVQTDGIAQVKARRHGGSIDGAEELARETAVDRTIIPTHRAFHDGLVAKLFAIARELLGNLGYRVFPADALPFVRTAFPDAFERILHAIGVVDVGHM